MTPNMSCTMLVVDPSSEIQSSILRHVEGRGISVMTALDPSAALASIERAAPDIVITDLFLPGEAGLALAQELRGRQFSCPVIVMAADASESVVVRAFRAGAIDYLHKPIVEEELVHALYRVRHLDPGSLADVSGVCRFEHRLTLGSDPAQAPSVIFWLIKTTAMMLSDARRLHLRGALQELLINAAEHGNLEISCQEKERALAEGRYEALVAQRLSRSRLKDRRIIVHAIYERQAKSLIYRIADEGLGFDWRASLNHAPNVCSGQGGNGRGIFLVRAVFPNLAYNERGNEVTLTVPLG